MPQPVLSYGWRSLTPKQIREASEDEDFWRALTETDENAPPYPGSGAPDYVWVPYHVLDREQKRRAKKKLRQRKRRQAAAAAAPEEREAAAAVGGASPACTLHPKERQSAPPETSGSAPWVWRPPRRPLLQRQ